MKNIKKYDKFVNENKLEDQLNDILNSSTDDGEGKYYTTISIDNKNSTIDLDFMERWHENREFEDEDDGYDFDSFYKLYKKNKYKRVISAVCGDSDITVYKSLSDMKFKINDEHLDTKFIRDNFINPDDDIYIECSSEFAPDENDFLYRGRLYEGIPDENDDYPNYQKQLLIDIVNDIEK